MMNDDVIQIGDDVLPVFDRRIRDMVLASMGGLSASALDRVGTEKGGNPRGLHRPHARVVDRLDHSWPRDGRDRATSGVFVIPGNDDPKVVDEVLAHAPERAVNVVRERAWIDDVHEIVGLDYVNPTPWHSPREAPEEGMATMIEAAFGRLDDPAHAIVNFHCPPSETSLDQAPALTDDLRPIVFGGRVMTEAGRQRRGCARPSSVTSRSAVCTATSTSRRAPTTPRGGRCALIPVATTARGSCAVPSSRSTMVAWRRTSSELVERCGRTPSGLRRTWSPRRIASSAAADLRVALGVRVLGGAAVPMRSEGLSCPPR